MLTENIKHCTIEFSISNSKQSNCKKKQYLTVIETVIMSLRSLAIIDCSDEPCYHLEADGNGGHSKIGCTCSVHQKGTPMVMCTAASCDIWYCNQWILETLQLTKEQVAHLESCVVSLNRHCWEKESETMQHSHITTTREEAKEEELGKE